MTELRDKRIAVVGVGLMGGLLLDRLLAAGTCSKEQIILREAEAKALFVEAVEAARSRMDALKAKLEL